VFKPETDFEYYRNQLVALRRQILTAYFLDNFSRFDMDPTNAPPCFLGSAVCKMISKHSKWSKVVRGRTDLLLIRIWLPHVSLLLAWPIAMGLSLLLFLPLFNWKASEFFPAHWSAGNAMTSKLSCPEKRLLLTGTRAEVDSYLEKWRKAAVNRVCEAFELDKEAGMERFDEESSIVK
jgi:hypothetical protein